MKNITMLNLWTVLLFFSFGFSQVDEPYVYQPIIVGSAESHISITHDHSGGSICWGYAQARALGKTVGDPYCDAQLTYIHKIDEEEFPFNNDPALTGIKVGDIVIR